MVEVISDTYCSTLKKFYSNEIIIILLNLNNFHQL
jgi:hypothetical protein